MTNQRRLRITVNLNKCIIKFNKCEIIAKRDTVGVAMELELVNAVYRFYRKRIMCAK